MSKKNKNKIVDTEMENINDEENEVTPLLENTGEEEEENSEIISSPIKLRDNENNEEVTEQDEIKSKSKKKSSIYLDYITRVILNSIIFIALLCVSLYYAFSSFAIIKSHTVNYSEASDIDYKVYIKENDFYESDYLDKNMSYISTLIKDIDATFNYDFKINEKSNVKFNYDIVGTLLIQDSTGKNTFYQKDYTLLEEKEVLMSDDTSYNINENLKIDYGYYNNLANQFRNNFGVSTTSNFIVTMKVTETSDDTLNINDTESFSLTIPLSQREVTIKLSQGNPVNNNEVTTKDTTLEVKNIGSLVFASILLILAIIEGIRFVKKILLLSSEKTKYDDMIAKILKEYDRLIVNTKTGPIIKEDDKVIIVDDFQELLDVRDNLKEPIMYYNIVNHQKCMFYINGNNVIYEYKLKAIDLEKEK